MAEEILGPSPESESGSNRLNRLRELDIGQVQRFSPVASGAGGAGRRPFLLPLENQRLNYQAGVDAPVDDTAAMAGLVERRDELLEDRLGAVRTHVTELPKAPVNIGLTTGLQTLDYQGEAYDMLRESQSFGEKVHAAFDSMNVAGAIKRGIERAIASREEAEQPFQIASQDLSKFSLEEGMWLARADTQAEFDLRVEQLQRDRDLVAAYSSGGALSGVGFALLGGALDPVNFLAGAGAVKLSQMYRASTTLTTLRNAGEAVDMTDEAVAAMRALNPTAAARRDSLLLAAADAPLGIAGTAVESGLGNVAITGMLDLAGERVTVNDYLLDFTLGAAIGAGARALELHIESANIEAAERSALARMELAAALDEIGMMEQARREVGGGDDGAVLARFDALRRERFEAGQRIALAGVDEHRRLVPTVDETMVDDAGRILPPREILLDDAQFADVSRRYGLDGPSGIQDPGERRFVATMYHRAERAVAAAGIKPERLATLLSRTDTFATTANTLLSSDNVLLKYLGTIIESSTSAHGNASTAAITKTMRRDLYTREAIGNYGLAFQDWLADTGRSRTRAHWDNSARHDFERQVFWYRTYAAQGKRMDGAHPAVVRAAGYLDAGYDMMRRDQLKVKTLGHARLPETSVGYMPRRFSVRWFKGATKSQLDGLAETLAQQVSTRAGWDLDFSRQWAVRYIDHARNRANGNVESPTNLTSDDSIDIARDVMRASGVDPDGPDAERLMGAFSRGGASYTRARVDLDPTAYVNFEGGRFQLGDIFEHNQELLFRGYAERASGEVALAQFGIYGNPGADAFVRALNADPRITPKEMEAVRMVFAEMLGRPFTAKGVTTHHRGLQTLTSMARSSMLGWMGLTQFAETFNAIGPLGLRATAQAVRELPAAIAAARAGRTDPLLESFEYLGVNPHNEHLSMLPYVDETVPDAVGVEDLTLIEKVAHAGGNFNAVASGYFDILRAQNVVVQKQVVLRALRFLRSGQEDNALREMGLSKELQDRLSESLDSWVRFREDGGVEWLDVTQATDAEAVRDFVQLTARGTAQIIQRTFVGETGKWAHDAFLRALFQFRTFGLVAHEKQMVRNLHVYGGVKAVGLLMTGMAIAVPLHVTRVLAASAGREDAEEYRERMLQADVIARASMNYVSGWGLGGDVVDGIAVLAGAESGGSRYGASRATDVVPLVGYIDRTAEALVNLDVGDTARALPTNSPLILPAFNLLRQVQADED